MNNIIYKVTQTTVNNQTRMHMILQQINGTSVVNGVSAGYYS